MNFAFGTKGESLLRLQGRLQAASICPSLLFDVGDWRRRSKLIVSEVVERFPRSRLAIRSSARGEDSWQSSMAGVHLSLTGIAARHDDVAAAIEEVVASYPDDHELHQVLVQPMVEDVAVSGVALTRDLDTGAPYYVVNYDDTSGRTDSVTGGAESKTILVHRSRPDALLSARFRKLIDVVKEIEAVTDCSTLDIEFCITAREEVYVLQVRPLAARSRWQTVGDDAIDTALDETRAALERSSGPEDGAHGLTTAYGEMPDWNPAEMIGSTPRNLALSLYRRLITDDVWLKARVLMGYRAMTPRPLLTAFAGRPYIDVRRSLNSFLPPNCDSGFADDLLTFQLAKLQANRDLHDRIEFAIAYTCRTPEFAACAADLRAAGFAAAQVSRFGDGLGALTAKILGQGRQQISRLLTLGEGLDERRRAANSLPPRGRAIRLLDDCIELGTLPFAQLARYAFIGISFIRALAAREALSTEDCDRFLESISTVATEFVHDLALVANAGGDHAAFLARYGHLRPGTYDITSWRYDERPDLYLGRLSTRMPVKSAFTATARQRSAIEKLLREEGFAVSAEELLGYVTAAVVAREKSKFLFSRNISDALSALADWGDALGLDREEIAHLPIEAIAAGLDRARAAELVAEGRAAYAVTRAVRLPHLIFGPRDIDVVRLPLGHPNFITHRTVTAPTCRLDARTMPDIGGHIVLIESADPGFDWIFSHPIAGLVTKYGGANSHMAIRCAEFAVPAAIGCGERLYDGLAKAAIIELDCASHRVRVIRS